MSPTVLSIVPIHTILRIDRAEFFSQHWGGTEMVISSGVYDCLELDGYAALTEENHIGGIITFIIKSQDDLCEIISLDSLYEGRGTGSQLLAQVEQTAALKGCQEVRLVTTNDNLEALRFYQKRGYRLTALYPDAVRCARLRKPSIPLLSDNGIQIRDELLLSKLLLD
ncbi:GNAT family N-acetyltransferase [Paenibacillus bovis]|uniref:N-acetyltransferase domain-containing protein n=1 Tax=Paenibacillus bovis TaxID=1616788 RepID=A0A172ZJ06_9BACL|nr:GNAT family N-acetyltransferase [Paenibacillus bovis]ANF97519.1 hypothetical protein AR543_16900 [Paenibacillus bovis]